MRRAKMTSAAKQGSNRSSYPIDMTSRQRPLVAEADLCLPKWFRNATKKLRRTSNWLI
jgi:hypothetical protein